MAESGGIAGRDGEAFAFAFALGSGIDVLRFGIEAKTTMAVTGFDYEPLDLLGSNLGPRMLQKV